MIARIARVWIALSCIAMAGCVPVEQAEVVKIQGSQLPGMPGPGMLACPFRLQEIVDARSQTGAGSLRLTAFEFPDVVEYVRQQLAGAGFAVEDPGPQSRVHIRILKVYFTEVGVTQYPAVVYDVRVGDGPSFLIRSQLPSFSVGTTTHELSTTLATKALANAFQDADAQLVSALNGRCAKVR